MNNLHPIAQAVQSQGRGKDTQLVHMTPNEVQGLHALAKAHGGSLSINPSTGLPEAGFLDSMLPTILGIGITAATGGAAAPWMIGAGIGGLQYMRTGSLEKGLMAGLGAYGGAGIGSSLMGAGATAASGVTSGAAGSLGPLPLDQIPAATMGDLAAEKAAQEALAQSAKDVATRTAATEAAKNAGTNLATEQARIAASNTIGENFSNMAAGAKNVFSDPTTFMKNYGGSGMDLAKYGGAAAAAPIMNAMAPEGGSGYKPDNERFDYTYDPGKASQEDLDAQRAAYAARGITGGELKYFNPTYAGPNKTYVAKGGLLSLAEGGMPSDYEYDPVSQTYKKVVQAPTGAVDPIGINGSGRTGDSSSDNQPLSQQTIDFLDKEEDTPGARDARMGKINDFVTELSKMSIVGAIARGLMGLGDNSEAAPAAPAAVAGQDSRGPASDDGSGPGNMGGGFSMGDGSGGYGAESSVGNMAKGGLLSLAAGGMSKGGFVVPADVVSALGNGSSDAGLRKLYALIGDVKPIKGKGDGLSDSIPTSIDGRQPARVADGEAYVNPKTVAKIGGGDAKKGAKKLYAMMDKIRQQAHGNKTQQRKVDPRKVV
jgi:hypothetical protein